MNMFMHNAPPEIKIDASFFWRVTKHADWVSEGSRHVKQQ